MTVAGSAENTISRVAQSANDLQELNLAFITYVCDLSTDDTAVSDAMADANIDDKYSQEYAEARFDQLLDGTGLDSDAFVDNLFDADTGDSLLVDKDGMVTAGGSSMISYYTQQISDSISVLSSLTKSASNIEKNTAQQLGRDLAQG